MTASFIAPSCLILLRETIVGHFGNEPYFLVVDSKIEEFERVGNLRREMMILNGLSKFLVGVESLKSKGVTDVMAVNIGEIAFSILFKHSIVVWKGAEVSPRKSLRGLVEGERPRLKAPTGAWRRFV